jgi:hypothetical protein
MVMTDPERISTELVRFERLVLVRRSEPERSKRVEEMVEIFPERERILFSFVRVLPEREVILFSVLATLPERLFTTHERAFCARVSVK